MLEHSPFEQLNIASVFCALHCNRAHKRSEQYYLIVNICHNTFDLLVEKVSTIFSLLHTLIKMIKSAIPFTFDIENACGACVNECAHTTYQHHKAMLCKQLLHYCVEVCWVFFSPSLPCKLPTAIEQCKFNSHAYF